MIERKMTWVILRRLRLRGLIPQYSESVQYEDEGLAEIVRYLNAASAEMDRLDAIVEQRGRGD